MEKSQIEEIAKQLAACEYILQTSDSQEDKDKAEKYAKLLYNQAVIIAGLQVEDPSEYADLVCSLMN